MPSSSALRDDASKGRTGMWPWWVKGCVLWEIWKPYVEEERDVSWLRTDPSDAVYVRGYARRAAVMAGGSSGSGSGWVHAPQVQPCVLHAMCADWEQGGLAHRRLAPGCSQIEQSGVRGDAESSVW